MTTPATLIGEAREALEDAQSYARLAEYQPTVRMPRKDAEPVDVDTRAAARVRLADARTWIDRAMEALRR